MTGSRETILAALAAAAPPGSATEPEPAPRPEPPADPLATLAASLRDAGGRLERSNPRSLGRTVAGLPGFANARHVFSAVPGIASRGLAETARAPAELAGLDFTLLPGELAVAESGAVWNVPRTAMDRAAALLAEHLVLVVPGTAVVATLHDAYARIDPGATVFGWFLAGPSKTADIEQALVLGAHGPRALTLVLV